MNLGCFFSVIAFHDSVETLLFQLLGPIVMQFSTRDADILQLAKRLTIIIAV